MGKDKTATPVASRQTAAQKHKKRTKYGQHDRIPQPVSGLVAKPVAPKMKYQSYFEFQENTDKKKKLEFQVTKDKTPQPGFTFVPVGNPELTHVCKELSREEDALIFIVSATQEKHHHLGEHVHRIGYHFRSYIVDQATIVLGGESATRDGGGLATSDADAIPDSQEEINKQADAALRDLYPRIPNTDREMIIQHAFQKGAIFNGKAVVGLQADLSLSRRVQLAVIAHIRHTHTRYDMLLRETDYTNARKTVEGLCLDILLKWRGDEETGRDQLDEVLREVVVISDSDSEDEDETDDHSEDDNVDGRQPNPTVDNASQSQSAALVPVSVSHPNINPRHKRPTGAVRDTPPLTSGIASRTRSKLNTRVRKNKKERREFRRYQAWGEAQKRLEQQHKDTDHTIDQLSSINMRQDRGSPQIVSDHHHTHTHDSAAQRIYNYDMERGQHRSGPWEHAQPSSYAVNEPWRREREEEVIRRRAADAAKYVQAFEYRPDAMLTSRGISPLRRGLTPPVNSRAFQGLQAAHETILPSIEQPIDLTGRSPVTSRYQKPDHVYQEPYRPQVMYQLRENDRESEYTRPVPRPSNIVYVDQHEMPKRRRLMVESDNPNDFSSGGDIVRLISRPEPERQVATGHAALLRERIDIRNQDVNNGYEYRGPSTSQVQFVKRIPEHDASIGKLSLEDPHRQAYSGNPSRSEPRVYTSHELHESQPYYKRIVVELPPGGSRKADDWLNDRQQLSRPSSHNSAPQDLQGRVASHIHTLPTYVRSDDRRPASVLAGSESHYPFVSRTQAEDESRVSLPRQEFRTVDGRRVYFPQDRLVPGVAEQRLPREEVIRLPEYREDIRFQSRYNEVPSPNRREVGIRRRSPEASHVMSAPVFVRAMPGPGEVIVLD